MTDLHADVTATFTADGADAFTVDAEFDVEDGETLVVLGPSGSGKTLLLEAVAGFHAHEGTVALDGEDVTDRPPEDRGFGFVFQDYALFPHLTVRENVAFGQRYSDRPVADARENPPRPDDWPRLEPAVRRVADVPLPNPGGLLESMGVADLADRSPRTLSGGEQQRVALARALAVDPDVLLLDEPLSALDVPTRQELRADLATVLADVTTVYVTHNRTTARAVADRIVVMHDGRVVQTGTPADVFERPTSPMVARFTGANCVPASVLPAAFRDDLGDPERVAFRPENVVLDGDDATATVQSVLREDAGYRVTLAVDGVEFDALTDAPPGRDAVGVTFPRDHTHPVADE